MGADVSAGPMTGLIRLRSDVTVVKDDHSQTLALYRGDVVERIVSRWPIAADLLPQLREGVDEHRAPAPLRELCAHLRSLGCIEEARPEPEASRHADQVRYYGLFHETPASIPEILRAATVAIIGMGGIGSELLRHLVAAGVGRIVMIDPDEVALSNLNRQFVYGMSDVGRPKVDCADRYVRQVSPSTEVVTARTFVDSHDALAAALAGIRETFIACCADQPAGTLELAVLGRCRETSAHAGFSAMHLTRGYWSLVSSQRARDNAFAFFTDVARRKSDVVPFGGGSASFANSTIAALFAEDVIRHLAGLEEPRASERLVEFDLRSLTSRVLLDFRTASQ